MCKTKVRKSGVRKCYATISPKVEGNTMSVGKETEMSVERQDKGPEGLIAASVCVVYAVISVHVRRP